jgi:hypothetical protein
MMKKTCIISLLCLVTLGRAQFSITRIEPGVDQQRLCVTVRMQNALSIKIEETIRSGLPALMDVRILLRDEMRKDISRQTITYRIQCDVWKEEYRIEQSEARWLFTSFDSVKIYFQTLHRLPVINLADLNAALKYQIWIQAEVMPISKNQSDKIREWLVESDVEDAERTRDQRNPAVHISLSNLIGSVFSREKKRELETEWRQSEFFAPASVR